MKMSQSNPVYPNHNKPPKESSRLSNSNLSKSLAASPQVVPRASKLMKQAWMNMLFVQSRQFLETLKQIHSIILKPYYLASIVQVRNCLLQWFQLFSFQSLRTMQGHLCCCHPSEKLQYEMIKHNVECISSIITQPFLNIEKLPSSAALRMMQNSKEWDGDIRLGGANQIKNIWHDLGRHI